MTIHCLPESPRLVKAESPRLAKAESPRLAKAERPRLVKAERPRLAKAERPRLAKVARAPRRFGRHPPTHFELCSLSLPKGVATWVDSLPTEWRGASVSCLDELAAQVVYGHLRDPFLRAHLVQAVEFVSDLA